MLRRQGFINANHIVDGIQVVLMEHTDAFRARLRGEPDRALIRSNVERIGVKFLEDSELVAPCVYEVEREGAFGRLANGRRGDSIAVDDIDFCEGVDVEGVWGSPTSAA